jgi:hypothetical protein
MRTRSTRVAVFAGALAVVLGAALTQPSACRTRRPPSQYSQRMVILGFDGLDPTLTGTWIRQGKLPNLKRLAEQGGMYALGTTHSAESPTAWASFATGVNPGKHNIYDFLVRDTSNYFPDFGIIRREPARFLFNYIPYRKPKVTSLRGGTSFWVTAGNAGVRSSVLTVPVTFPPEDVPNGELLSGLPLPDIRGTMGTFYYFATNLNRDEEGSTEFGGILKRLVVENDVARTELVGPPDPIVREQIRSIRSRQTPLDVAERAEVLALEAREDIRIPLTIRWNRAAKTATVDIAGESVPLERGRTSRWIELDFRVNLLASVHGMAQLLLIDADSELQLYVSPVNWKPDNPPAPISSPSTFSGELLERLGYYRTLGWAEATWALNEGRLDEKAFMEDLYRAFDDRAQVILSRIDSRDWDVLVGVIESTDRVQHMMSVHRPEAPHARRRAGRAVRGFDRAGVPARGSVRRRGGRAPRTGHTSSHRVGSRVPFMAQIGQPQHLADRARLHGGSGRAAGRKNAGRPVRRRTVLGERRLEPDAGVRDGARPDLLQPART